MPVDEKLHVAGDFTDRAPELVDPRTVSSAFIAAASTTNLSTTISFARADLMAGVVPGCAVSGVGVPGGATIASVDPGHLTAVLSAAATATGTPNLTFTRTQRYDNIGDLRDDLTVPTDRPLSVDGAFPAVLGKPTSIVPTGGVGQISTAYANGTGAPTGVEIIALKQTTDINGATVFVAVKKGDFTVSPGVLTGLAAGTYKVRVRGYKTTSGETIVGPFAADSGTVAVT